MLEKPAVIHADHCRERGWGSDVVRSVNEVDIVEPSVNSRPRPASPESRCETGRKRQSGFIAPYLGSKTQHEWLKLNVVSAPEGI